MPFSNNAEDRQKIDKMRNDEHEKIALVYENEKEKNVTKARFSFFGFGTSKGKPNRRR